MFFIGLNKNEVWDQDRKVQDQDQEARDHVCSRPSQRPPKIGFQTGLETKTIHIGYNTVIPLIITVGRRETFTSATTMLFP